MVLNVLGGNVDDHNKNFSFLMGNDGRWHVAPAYDYTFSVDPDAPYYVNRHSMTVNNKTEGIAAEDLMEVAPVWYKGRRAVHRKGHRHRLALPGIRPGGRCRRRMDRNDRKGNRRTSGMRERQPGRPIKIEHGISCRGNEPTRHKSGWVCHCHSAAPFLLRRVNWSGRSGNQ